VAADSFEPCKYLTRHGGRGVGANPHDVDQLPVVRIYTDCRIFIAMLRGSALFHAVAFDCHAECFTKLQFYPLFYMGVKRNLSH
jgi:hypothetical protein